MTLVGSYLSPKKADALFRLFFSDQTRFSLFVNAIKEHTFCDRDGLRFIGEKCYAPEYSHCYSTIIQGCLPNLQELALATFSKPGNLSLQLANDDHSAPIVYSSRYHLVHLKGEELRKVIDTLQNKPHIFPDKNALKVTLFEAIFQTCNSAQAEEYFPWTVWGSTAITDEEGRKKIISMVKRINSEIVVQFHADSSQSQEDMTRSLSQKRAASPVANEPAPKRHKKGTKS